jgi:hypothetical protein
MASGGLVAFNEGGDVKRFQQGAFIGEDPSVVADYDTPSPISAFFGNKDEAIARLKFENKKRDERAARAKALAQGELPAVETVQTKSGSTIPTSINTPVAEIPAKSDPVAKAAQADIPLPPPYSLPASRGGAGTDYMKIFQGIKAPSAPTAAEEAAIAKSGEERYATAVPNRLESVEKELGSRTQNLKDRRKSALNEALMMAGIGVLKSKSPGRYFGEGAEEGMLAYRQSMKDVRGGEDLMTQARQDLAKAQILQDQGKFEAGQKMLERGIQKEQLAVSRINLESQNAAQIANAGIANQGNAIQSRRVDIEAGLAPYAALGNIARANLYSARGINAGISDADQKAAETAAFRELMSVGMAEGTPGYAQAYEDAYRRHLQRRMPGSVPGQPAQVPVRGEAQGAR